MRKGDSNYISIILANQMQTALLTTFQCTRFLYFLNLGHGKTLKESGKQILMCIRELRNDDQNLKTFKGSWVNFN